MYYKLFKKDTGEPLGRASSIESLGELLIDLIHDDGLIYPDEIEVIEVKD